MHNDQEHNSKKIFGLLKHGAGGVTLGLGSSSLILVVTTAIALVAIATTAWLASNREVDSGSMADLNAQLYELAAPSPLPPTPSPDILYNSANDATHYSSFTDAVRNLLPGFTVATEALQETTASQPDLLIALKPNWSSPFIKPGASGTLTFYFVPKVQKNMTAHFSIDLQAFQKTDDAVVPDAVLKLLKGHILFFRQLDPDTQKYSDPLYDASNPGVLEFDYNTADHTSEKDDSGRYPITLYWVWPQTVSKVLLLDGARNLYGSASLFAEQTQITNLIALMYADPALFFQYSYDNLQTDAANETAYRALLDTSLWTAETDANTQEQPLKALSDGYNNADQEIGDNVYYLTAVFSSSVEINTGE